LLISRRNGLLLLHDWRCLSLPRHWRCLHNMAMLRRRVLLDTRETSGLLAVNYVEVLCVYRRGDVWQQGDGGRHYMLWPRKPIRRRHICNMGRKTKKTTCVDRMRFPPLKRAPSWINTCVQSRLQNIHSHLACLIFVTTTDGSCRDFSTTPTV
jgi:hypothetical protein